MNTDLPTRLRERLEFQGGIPSLQPAANAGRALENARLKPLHEAMLKCVKRLIETNKALGSDGEYPMTCERNYTALAELERAL